MSGKNTMPTRARVQENSHEQWCFPLWRQPLRLVDRSFELCPQLGGCRPFPRSESSIEGIRILVAEQVCHLCVIDIRSIEVLARQFLPRLQKQLTKTRAVVIHPPLQG